MRAHLPPARVALPSLRLGVAPPLLARSVPEPAVTLAAAAALTCDDRWRGSSRSDRGPVIQASPGLAHRAGLFVSAWSAPGADTVGASARCRHAAGLAARAIVRDGAPARPAAC